MAEPSGARAAALKAEVAVAENPDPATADENPLEPADRERRLRRLRADVEMCQRVVDEMGDAPAKVEAKYAQRVKHQAAELKAAKRSVADAERALKAAQKALADEEGN